MPKSPIKKTTKETVLKADPHLECYSKCSYPNCDFNYPEHPPGTADANRICKMCRANYHAFHFKDDIGSCYNCIDSTQGLDIFKKYNGGKKTAVGYKNMTMAQAELAQPRKKSGWDLYRQEMYSDLVGIPFEQISKHLATGWKNLTTDEKEAWNVKARESALTALFSENGHNLIQLNLRKELLKFAKKCENLGFAFSGTVGKSYSIEDPCIIQNKFLEKQQKFSKELLAIYHQSVLKKSEKPHVDGIVDFNRMTMENARKYVRKAFAILAEKYTNKKHKYKDWEYEFVGIPSHITKRNPGEMTHSELIEVATLLKKQAIKVIKK